MHQYGLSRSHAVFTYCTNCKLDVEETTVWAFYFLADNISPGHWSCAQHSHKFSQIAVVCYATIGYSLGFKGWQLNALRGYCIPDQFFDCLCLFLKNYNTLVTSKICFLNVTFQGTQLLHWNFTKSSGYWFMVQNIENIDFRTFFAVTSQQWPLLK